MKHPFVLPVAAIVMCATTAAYAQVAPAQDIVDTWQGTLHAGKDLRLVVKISRAPETEKYKGVFYSIDQGAGSIPISNLTLQSGTVKMDVSAIGGKYEAKLSPDAKTMTGDWTQGPSPLPLILTRATPETAWAIPEPPPKIPPMAPDASPSFDVATIKPSKPDAKGMGFSVRGRRIATFNTNLVDLISFAYGVHAKQITGAPAWMTEDKYDIDGTPDLEGQPSDKQLKGMMQKLLAERFQLKFHNDKKELSVYVLSVAKSGPKLEKGDADFNGLPGLFFTKLGAMTNRNATMHDFATVMQAAVLDRPVIDQTGLTGRYNFLLNWTPDDSQFAGMGARVPPPTDAANAPPDLFTAIQAQDGLKLEATKAAADVIVIDHVEKPSAN